MANSKHLQRLNQGKRAWAVWRDANPDVHPDFSGADLRKRILRRLDLSRSNLSGADLRDISLRRADLSMAILDGAKLHRAFLSNTKLKGASFRKTVLSETVFAGVDLSKAKNLTTCVHRSPSVLDHRTLLRSRALPLKFLQGCGLPDHFITALGDRLILKQYCSCFISYSSRDQTFADRLYADLQANGVRCWFAPKDMPLGAKLRESIDEAISENDKMLLVLSKNSIASSWVEKEFETGFEEERRRQDVVLFPIMLDHSPFESREGWIADIRRARNIGDFSRWMDDVPYKEAFDHLLRALQRNR